MDGMIERGRHHVSVALLLCALVIGGSAGPTTDLIVELLGLILLGLVLAKPGRLAGGWPVRLALAAAAVIALIPLAQLLPLPPAIWRSLPGRDLSVNILDSAGLGGGWRPFSLDPEATWRSLFYLVPAIALFLSVLQADLAGRRTLVVIVVAGAFLSLLLGVLQVTAGGVFYLYPTPHEGNAVGIFVNRNHAADILLIGVALIPAVADWRPRRHLRERPDGGAHPLAALLLAAGAMVALALVVPVTISRAGTILMPPVLAVSLLRLILGARLFHDRRRVAIIAAGVIALTGIGLVAVLALSGVAQSTAGRFAGAAGDVRQGYWTDTLYALHAYLPWGSGVGSFVPVYATVASLDQVVPQYVNHAHNDYLELALETGWAGGLALLLFGVALLSSALVPMAGAARRLRGSALLAIAILLAHSAVDYPLRTLCLICVFGVVCALMFPRSGRSEDNPV